MAKKRLEEMDFSTAHRKLNARVGNILHFESSTALAVLGLRLEGDMKAAQSHYRAALKVARKYSEEEMPEMYALLRKLKREYGFR